MTGEILNDWTSVPAAHESMSVYRARPAGAALSGTAIVGFEMFGLTRYIRAVTERIARLRRGDGDPAVRAGAFYHGWLTALLHQAMPRPE